MKQRIIHLFRIQSLKQLKSSLKIGIREFVGLTPPLRNVVPPFLDYGMEVGEYEDQLGVRFVLLHETGIHQGVGPLNVLFDAGRGLVVNFEASFE